MVFAERFEASRCALVRATESDLDALMSVFDDNLALLRSIGTAIGARELAEDAVFNKTLPPNGIKERACTCSAYAKTTGSLVGVLEYYVGYPNETCLWIAKLFLAKAAQRMHYGQEIVSELETMAKRNGITEIRTAINVPNWGALWFWRESATQPSAAPTAPHPRPTACSNSPSIFDRNMRLDTCFLCLLRLLWLSVSHKISQSFHADFIRLSPCPAMFISRFLTCMST